MLYVKLKKNQLTSRLTLVPKHKARKEKLNGDILTVSSSAIYIRDMYLTSKGKTETMAEILQSMKYIIEKHFFLCQ